VFKQNVNFNVEFKFIYPAAIVAIFCRSR